ncbi:MAG: HEAT repeat domain-containing protein [Promethearchaeota archaeon]
MDSDTQINDFNLAMKNLFHGEVMERATAARTLGHLKEGRATNLLVKALNSEKDPVVINRIIEAMGEIKDPKATIPIVNVLRKELGKPEEFQDNGRIFIIIESLMKIGDKRALEHLGILLESCHEDIRRLTEQAFQCIDPNFKINLKKIK